MEIIHEKSHPNIHMPELTGLWIVPPTQTDIVRTYHEVVDVKGDLDHVNELPFETGPERDFIDLSDPYLEIKFQVVCNTGSVVGSSNLALSNLYGHSLFEKVTLTDRSGCALSNLNESRYPYQAMLLTLLTKTKSWGSSGAGQIEGWYGDTAAQHEAKTAANTSSQGAHWSLTHRGSLSISGSFAAVPPHPVTIIAIGLVQSVVEVSMDRSVLLDFTD